MNYSKYNYQFFPLRSTAISKYCTFDTKALVELFMDSGKMDFFENIDENKKIIWGKYFNMNNKIFKNNNYNFDYTIITNGETVSIRFISREAEMKNNKGARPGLILKALQLQRDDVSDILIKM